MNDQENTQNTPSGLSPFAEGLRELREGFYNATVALEKLFAHLDQNKSDVVAPIDPKDRAGTQTQTVAATPDETPDAAKNAEATSE